MGALLSRAAGRWLTAAIIVTSLVTTAGAAAADVAPLQVSGLITDAASGTPLSGVCASYVDPADPASRNGEACSGPDGKYTLDLFDPGHFAIRVDDPSGLHAGALGAAFDIAAGQQISGQNFALGLAGTVSGVVVDRATGTPLRDICPSASLGRLGSYVIGQLEKCSDATGHWSVRGLPGTGVTVRLGGDQTHVSLWAADAAGQSTATVLQVVPGQEITAGTVRLHHGATLTGLITDAAGVPVEGAWVELGVFSSRCGTPCSQYAAQTGADGQYTIANIEPQQSIVSVSAIDQRLATAFSGGARDPGQARKIAFRFDASAQLNARLSPEARLEVTLNRIPGSDYAQVDAYSLSGVRVGSGADVLAPGGTVTLGGLSTGPVRLQVTYDDGQQAIWYDGANNATEARTIKLTAGATTAIRFTVS